MELTKILTADVLDIIFEGRNKEYGAYELRKSYRRRLLISITVMLTVMLLLYAGYVLANRGDKGQIAKSFEIPDNELKLIDQEKPVEPPPPPPIKQTPPPQVEMKQFTPPRIVHDEEVKPEEAPPPMTELEDTKIGTINQEGVKDDNTVAPPVDEGGKGVTAIEHKEEAVDKIWTSVQIESQYPGGPQAWARFLNKNLSKNLPQEAIDNEIQGRVEIKFVVDTLGNVSDVEAISGPKELWDAAIKVIKMSGKWEPAIQNGRHVKSYKRQPIIIQISNE